jgi:hypothetical protein
MLSSHTIKGGAKKAFAISMSSSGIAFRPVFAAYYQQATRPPGSVVTGIATYRETLRAELGELSPTASTTTGQTFNHEDRGVATQCGPGTEESQRRTDETFSQAHIACDGILHDSGASVSANRATAANPTAANPATAAEPATDADEATAEQPGFGQQRV